MNKLIVALDVESGEEAKRLVKLLAPEVEVFKIGSQIFTALGPEIVRYVENLGKKVFLDLKFHDIPNTVANAVTAAVEMSSGGLLMYTMHTVGGAQMLSQAVAAGKKRAQQRGFTSPLALGITVLTSEAATDNISALVMERAKLGLEAGCDGVVCSAEEVGSLKKKFGNRLKLVTPGIRPAGEAAGDQKRTATPAQALKNGSDYLVVGRPIVKAADPLEATRKILEEIRSL